MSSYVILYVENGGGAFLLDILFHLRGCRVARHRETKLAVSCVKIV